MATSTLARRLLGGAAVAAIITVGLVPAANAATPTTTTLSVPTPDGYGSAPTVGAVVQAAQGHRSGHVVFTVDGTTVGTPGVDGSGLASARVPANIAVGRHVLRAIYYPTVGTTDVNSQASRAFDIIPAPSRWTLSVASPVVFGTSPIVHAVLSSTAPVAGAMAYLFHGSNLIDMRPVNASGAVDLRYRVLWRDGTPIRVLDRGSATRTAGSGSLLLNVSRGPSSVSVSAPTSLARGAGFTVTAGVSGAVTPPSGPADVVIDGQVRGTFTVTNGRGSIALGPLTSGRHSVQVSYGGDFTHLNASSAVLTVTVAAPPAPPPAPSGCAATARACVDLTHSVTWLQSNGKVVYGPVPISSGRPGYRTPAGTYHVYWKDIDHWSSTYNAPMPYSVFFNGGIAFHQGDPGVPSHGCIHLLYSSATFYFSTLNVGDTVDVFGYAPY